MPKISIVIPVYNTAKYLKECLDSLLNQTLEDFEVILVNDDSKDNSLEILNAYAKKDSRFIVIDKKNEGQGIARNIAIEKSCGRYLLCMDSDDWLENNALELAYNKMSQENVDVLFFDYYKYFEKTKEKYEIKYTNVYKIFENKPFSPKEAGKILFNSNCLTFKMYKTDFIKKNEIKYSNHNFMEDAPFYFKALLLAEKIDCLKTPIYTYRIHSKSSTFKHAKYLTSIPKVFDICFEIIRKNNDNQEILYSFLKNRKKSMLYHYSITPFLYKFNYYKMMQKVIKNNFSKYELEPILKKISSSSFIQYELLTRIKKTMCILKTHII